ncbi:histidine decarboxylase-like, partial [Nilaparvata lugens]|uniref:histidine decarboxylase-like n=1 Tax=Nilaparvata lugens TaxID=108931 RepID=UPI00193DFBFD
QYVICFTVTSQRTTEEDIVRDWNEIRSTAGEILKEVNQELTRSPSRVKVRLAETRERNANFGSSRLLANSPMSTKIVNGSFVAVFDNGGAVSQCANVLSNLQTQSKDSPGK